MAAESEVVARRAKEDIEVAAWSLPEHRLLPWWRGCGFADAVVEARFRQEVCGRSPLFTCYLRLSPPPVSLLLRQSAC